MLHDICVTRGSPSLRPARARTANGKDSKARGRRGGKCVSPGKTTRNRSDEHLYQCNVETHKDKNRGHHETWTAQDPSALPETLSHHPDYPTLDDPPSAAWSSQGRRSVPCLVRGQDRGHVASRRLLSGRMKRQHVPFGGQGRLSRRKS